MFLLVSSDDLGRRLVFPLVKVKTTIGRDPSCDITLDDPEVSREHVKVYIIDDTVKIKDMNSTNGTFLNNCKIDRMTDMEPASTLIVGPNFLTLEKNKDAKEEEIELTCMLTIQELRELADKPIPERSFIVNDEEDTDSTMISNREKLIAGIYNKQVGLAKFPSIEIIFGNDIGKKYLLPHGEYSIGRDKKCNIYLNDEKISNVHGTFLVEQEGVTYRDEESLNGSILDNRNVKKSLLKHKDTLMLGRTKLRFLDPNQIFDKDTDIVFRKKETNENQKKTITIFTDLYFLIEEYWYITAVILIAFIFLFLYCIFK